MTCRFPPHLVFDCTFGRVVAMLVVSAGLLGCAGPQKSGQPAPEKPNEQPSEQSSQSPEHFGADPMGLARRWAHDPPWDVPGDAGDRLRSWEKGLVLRLVRREDGGYRALLAPTDSKEAEAVVLTIERSGGEWQVTDTEHGEGNYLWPRM